VALRLSVLICALSLVLYSATSLFASSRSSYVCCSGSGDCNAGEKCCQAEGLGWPACDGGGGDSSGYCMSGCIPDGS
jgi:hypothetical protein